MDLSPAQSEKIQADLCAEMQLKPDQLAAFDTAWRTEISENMVQYSSCSLPGSVTNHFFEVKSENGKIYLIRKNGLLWLPYTRADESDNLGRLHELGIQTNVISNGSGFQICRFVPEENRFSSINDENVKTKCLEKVAELIKRYQTTVEFQNALSIRTTLSNSFEYLPKDKKMKLQHYYDLIMKIICVVEQDGKNMVSSHNDLLPSSVYNIDGDMVIVDWEYSALNHPYYDLAHISVHSSLTVEQDQALLNRYDGSIKQFSVGRGLSFVLMKAFISFLPLVWNRDPNKEDELLDKFQASFKNAVWYVINNIYN